MAGVAWPDSISGNIRFGNSNSSHQNNNSRSRGGAIVVLAIVMIKILQYHFLSHLQLQLVTELTSSYS